jgi:hypothetical protein
LPIEDFGMIETIYVSRRQRAKGWRQRCVSLRASMSCARVLLQACGRVSERMESDLGLKNEGENLPGGTARNFFTYERAFYAGLKLTVGSNPIPSANF